MGRSPGIASRERRRHLSNQSMLAEASKSRENGHLSASSLASLQISREDGLACQRAEAISPPDEVGNHAVCGRPKYRESRYWSPASNLLAEGIGDLRRVSASSQGRRGQFEPCTDC